MSGELQLPPGFRFHPTDEELVMHYLCRKCTNQPIPVPIIKDIDLYRFDPWLLPEMDLNGEKEWYFFSPRDRKYPNGSRPNRAAGTGYWKATGADKPIGKPKTLGIKKALVFYAGKAPRGEKTNWIMHEYRLAGVDRSARKKNHTLRLDDWVLCRIYNKKRTIERGFRSVAPLFEEKKRTLEEYLMDMGEEKPMITAGQVKPTTTRGETQMSDLTQFDSSDSRLRTHTSDSSCSRVQPASQEKEVQSEPIWKSWEKSLDIPSIASMDALLGIVADDGAAAPANNHSNNLFFNSSSLSYQDFSQLSPLFNPYQDPFLFLQKPF